MKTLILLSVLGFAGTASAEDYEGPHHFNVVFTPETTVAEVAWQALNVIDTEQTLYISRHPDKFQESGQAEMFAGTHPSKKGVLLTMIGFAVVHYAVTVGIENLVEENPDYRVLQRVWQYSTLGYKTYVVAQNRAYGIKN
jgi:hypothetical protein